MRMKKLLAAFLAGTMLLGSTVEVFAGSDTLVETDEVWTVGETQEEKAETDKAETDKVWSVEETAVLLTVGESVIGNLESGETAIFEFTPETDGAYVFESESDNYMYGILYDSNGNELAYNDDGGEGGNFSIEKFLTAGENYYLYVTEYYGNPVEEFAVSVNVYTGVC